MRFPIVRQDAIVTAYDGDGRCLRSVKCRDVRNAVALEAKLTNDQAFAERWAWEPDPKMPGVRPHASERPRRL